MISKAIDKIIIDFLLQMNRWFINHVMFVFAYVTSNTISPIYVSFLFIFFLHSVNQTVAHSSTCIEEKGNLYASIHLLIQSLRWDSFKIQASMYRFFYYYYQEHVCSPIFFAWEFHIFPFKVAMSVIIFDRELMYILIIFFDSDRHDSN